MKAFINGNEQKEISLADLTAFPHFLRFNDVNSFFNYSHKLITEKCQLVENYLYPLKGALIDSKSIIFCGDIYRNGYMDFASYSFLLNYLSDRMLPICNLSRRYEFYICFYSDKEAVTNVISSIIQMSQVKNASDLKLRLSLLEQSTHLPIKVIMVNGMIAIGQNRQNIVLELCLYDGIQNVVEICNHLLEVLLFY